MKQQKEPIRIQISSEEAKEIIKQQKLKEKQERKGIAISIDALRLSVYVFVFLVGSVIIYYTYFGDPTLIPDLNHIPLAFDSSAVELPALEKAYAEEDYEGVEGIYTSAKVENVAANFEYKAAFLVSMIKLGKAEQVYRDSFDLEMLAPKKSNAYYLSLWIRAHIAEEVTSYKECRFVLEILANDPNPYRKTARLYLEEVNDFLSGSIW